MKRPGTAALLGALLGFAAVMGSPATQADEATSTRLGQDAVCTRCHDESETRPILAMYQTPHGVTGDGRTPSCQSCHGASAGHVAGDTEGKGRPAPDVIFGSKHTPAGYKPSDPQVQTKPA